jgi:hypothetical protein
MKKPQRVELGVQQVCPWLGAHGGVHEEAAGMNDVVERGLLRSYVDVIAREGSRSHRSSKWGM